MNPAPYIGLVHLPGGPIHSLVVKTHFDGWLDHSEVRGDIEIARRIERTIADMVNLLSRIFALYPRNRRQYGKADVPKRLRDKRGANQSGGVARSKCYHPSPPELKRLTATRNAHFRNASIILADA